jgi:hypothetical protein
MNVVRMMVILIILTAATITGEIVFVVTTIGEEWKFKHAYHDVAEALIGAFHTKIKEDLWIARSLATSLAEETTGWPNVTFTNYEKQCEGPLHLSRASTITVSPLVEIEQRSLFEAYASEFYPLANPPSSAYDNDNVTYVVTNRTPSQGIYEFVLGGDAVDAAQGSIYFPNWQMHPGSSDEAKLAPGILFDEASHPVRGLALRQMLERSGSVVSSFLFENKDDVDMAFYEKPRSVIYSPIIDSHGAILGSVNLQFQWESIFRDVLHKGTHGSIVVVIGNSCDANRTFSYSVNGANSTFLGAGDFHETNTDSEVEYKLQNSTYSSFAELFDGDGSQPIAPLIGCNYRIDVYPSAKFQQSFSTERPTMYRFLVFGALFFVVAIFVFFDCMVERQQKKVNDAAKQSGKYNMTLGG